MRTASFFRTLRCNRKGLPDSPRFLTYLVTFRCNARCIMCDCWRKPPEEELSLGEIEKVFRQLPRMDGIRLSGGEPFLRSDLEQIADLAHKHLEPKFLHITTNGLLTERIVKFCRDRECDTPLRLLVSVDAVGEDHDRLRGVSGAWEQAVDTLKRLAPLRKTLRLKLAVNQTIVDANGILQHRLLTKYFKPLRIPVNAVMAYDGSAIYSVKKETALNPVQEGRFRAFGDFSRSEVEELLCEVDANLKRRSLWEKIGKRYYWWGIRNRMLEDDLFPNPRCVALGSHMRLLPDGKVPTCQFNALTVGDLRLQDFIDVWEGEKIRSQRRWVANCQGCWAECEVLPNAVYSGEILTRIRFLFRRRLLGDRCPGRYAMEGTCLPEDSRSNIMPGERPPKT